MSKLRKATKKDKEEFLTYLVNNYQYLTAGNIDIDKKRQNDGSYINIPYGTSYYLTDEEYRELQLKATEIHDNKAKYRDVVGDGKEYDLILTSKVAFGPRGEYYGYALIKDKKIVAFGEEQGNYAGGIFASVKFNTDGFLKAKETVKSQYPTLYERIKDYPLAKPYKPAGKCIYKPKGKAGEYSEYACNFYTGCSNDCDYCYCKRGVMKHVWTPEPHLKKCFKDIQDAMDTFRKELEYYQYDMRDSGLFFSFTTDPLLPTTGGLTVEAVNDALRCNVPVVLLTKSASGAVSFIKCMDKIGLLSTHKDKIAIGFTLTGHDELEKNASTNERRIEAMRYAHNLGLRTFASIEPIIDLPSAREMVMRTLGICDLYKIGLMSGGKSNAEPSELSKFVESISPIINSRRAKVYWKNSVVDALGGILPTSTGVVDEKYNIFLNPRCYE